MYDLRLQAPIELINIVPFNPLISKCQIKVCWVGDEPNRNKSIITKEAAKELANSLPGSPIVGYYNEATEDFEEHNKIIEIKNGIFKLKPTTQPYGFIDLGAKVWFQKFLDNDGVEREYLVTEGWLWTGQFPECKRVIDKGNGQSMELDDKSIDAYWTKEDNGDKKFFIINEAIISKLCILGEDYTPCFEGSEITAPKIEFSFEDSFKERLFSMMTEIKNILNEGGAEMTDAEPVVQEPVEPIAEEPTTEPETVDFVEEICPKCGKPISECTCEKDEPVKYVLDEIPEYIELQQNYANLENQYNELLKANEALKADNEALTSFKVNIEKKEKEDMINSFYMLSDELKKDVIENIDSYSLDDIEAKLSILCVRNKVSFDLEKNKDTEPTTYTFLDEEGSSGIDTPEWIKAVQAVTKEN